MVLSKDISHTDINCKSFSRFAGVFLFIITLQDLKCLKLVNVDSYLCFRIKLYCSLVNQDKHKSIFAPFSDFDTLRYDREESCHVHEDYTQFCLCKLLCIKINTMHLCYIVLLYHIFHENVLVMWQNKMLFKKLFAFMKISRIPFVDICVLMIQWLKCSYLEGIFDLFDWVLSLHTWLDMDSMSLQMIRNTLQVSTG